MATGEAHRLSFICGCCSITKENKHCMHTTLWGHVSGQVVCEAVRSLSYGMEISLISSTKVCSLFYVYVCDCVSHLTVYVCVSV